jgi:hypothetical protein
MGAPGPRSRFPTLAVGAGLQCFPAGSILQTRLKMGLLSRALFAAGPLPYLRRVPTFARPEPADLMRQNAVWKSPQNPQLLATRTQEPQPSKSTATRLASNQARSTRSSDWGDDASRMTGSLRTISRES